jgi:cell division protein FtsB
MVKKAILLFFLLILCILLQLRLWQGEGGIREKHLREERIAVGLSEIAQLKDNNHFLDEELKDLKNGLEALEERARVELGMIKTGEVFYHYFQ